MNRHSYIEITSVCFLDIADMIGFIEQEMQIRKRLCPCCRFREIKKEMMEKFVAFCKYTKTSEIECLIVLDKINAAIRECQNFGKKCIEE